MDISVGAALGIKPASRKPRDSSPSMPWVMSGSSGHILPASTLPPYIREALKKAKEQN